jgi:LPXTG-motif cell wall-anchored protein
MMRRLLLLAGAFVLLLATPSYAQYVGGVATDTPTVAPGEPVTLTACCFQPGTAVTFSGPGGALTTVTADANGVATTTVGVPATAATGTVTVTATGVDAAGNPVSETGSVTIAVAAATEDVTGGVTATTIGSSGLPVTGSDSSLPLSFLAAGLVVMGAATLLIVRHRRESVLR